MNVTGRLMRTDIEHHGVRLVVAPSQAPGVPRAGLDDIARVVLATLHANGGTAADLRDALARAEL